MLTTGPLLRAVPFCTSKLECTVLCGAMRPSRRAENGVRRWLKVQWLVRRGAGTDDRIGESGWLSCCCVVWETPSSERPEVPKPDVSFAASKSKPR